MIKIYADNDVYPLTEINNWHAEESETGIMSMSFDVDIKHSHYNLLQEETVLEYDNLYYKIKTINERTRPGVSTVKAEIDLDDLKGVAWAEYKITTQTFDYVCNNLENGILNGTGWRVENIVSVTGQRSVNLQDVTPIDVLRHCTNTTMYNRKWHFDNKKKVITPININLIEPQGAYFTDELNLTELTFKGSSEGLITRLYAYGKDGLDITKYAGREYVENHDYSDKIIAAIWRDERYTNAQNLYDDAIDKLKDLSKPARSYECKVIDLAALSKDYDFLKVQLYDVVTLIDRNRGIRIDHRVVNIKRYPNTPDKNVVTLSSMATKITSKLNTLQTDFNKEKIVNKEKWNEITRDLEQNSAAVGELYTIGEDNKIYLLNTITQTAESTVEQIRKSQTTGTENLIINPKNFKDTFGWSKSNGSAWSFATENNFLKIQHLDSAGKSNIYINGNLRQTVILSRKQNNFYTVYTRVKASAPCKIYLCCWCRDGENGIETAKVIYADSVRSSNLTQSAGDAFYQITVDDTWVDIYAQIQNPFTTTDRYITRFGIYLSADQTPGNSPPGITVWMDYIQFTATAHYEERITTVEKTADGIKTEVSKKVSKDEFDMFESAYDIWKSNMTQTAESINLSVTQLATNLSNNYTNTAGMQSYVGTQINLSSDKILLEAKKNLSVGSVNYIKNHSNFTNTNNWSITNTAAWQLSIVASYPDCLRLYHATSTAATCYLLGDLTEVATVDNKQYLTINIKVRPSAKCRIYLCYQYRDSTTGAFSTSVLWSANIKTSNCTGNGYWDIAAGDVNQWQTLTAQIYNPNGKLYINKVGFYLPGNLTEAPAGLAIYMENAELKTTPFFEEQIASLTIESDAITARVENLNQGYTELQATYDALTSKVVTTDSTGKQFSTLLRQSSTDVTIAWNNISSIVQIASGGLNILPNEGVTPWARFDSNGLNFIRLKGSLAGQNMAYFGRQDLSADGVIYSGVTQTIDYAGDFVAWGSKATPNSGLSISAMLTRSSFNGYPARSWQWFVDQYTNKSLTFTSTGGIIMDGSGGIVVRNGDVWVNGGSIYIGGQIVSPSDIRLKANIQNTEINGLDVINRIKLQSFDWRANGRHEDIGILAQQLQEVVPSLVEENPESGMLGISETGIIKYLIKAVQELSATQKGEE